MSNNNITIQERTDNFAFRAINAYSEINKNYHFNDAVVVISKQFLRSSTSIGANIVSAIYAQSNKDFISKYSIALNYLIQEYHNKQQQQRMIKSNIISQNKMSLMLQETENIIKILTSIINKLKAKE